MSLEFCSSTLEMFAEVVESLSPVAAVTAIGHLLLDNLEAQEELAKIQEDKENIERLELELELSQAMIESLKEAQGVLLEALEAEMKRSILLQKELDELKKKGGAK